MHHLIIINVRTEFLIYKIHVDCGGVVKRILFDT